MFASVIVDITNIDVDKIFEYAIGDMPVQLGSRVKVPFGKKIIEGIVIGINENSVYDVSKIKNVLEVIEDTPVLTNETVELMNYMKDSCYLTRASILRLFLPSEMRKGKVKEKFENYISLVDDFSMDILDSFRKSAVKQIEAIKYLHKNGKTKQSFLNSEFGNSAVKSIVEKGYAIVTLEQNFRSPYKKLEIKDKKIILTDKQQNAVESILATDKLVTLLYGVTGSGKTEVYLNIIDNALKNGKTAIMLVPEIALTPQMLKQLRARFDKEAAILHSGLSAGERFDEWWRIRSGEAKVVIGARSAIFAPISNVGVIIIDEEHDGSYVSEGNPRYSTLGIAKFRAQYNNAKLVLGSATPSIESFLRAKSNVYNLVELPDRVNKRALPDIEIVDMRSEIRRGNNSPFSSALVSEIESVLKNKKQCILFLNQRGYSKSVICTECGHVQKCEACDVSLTYHREDNALLCHYCGAKYKMISSCTACGSKFLRFGGTGTERVVDELKKLFPSAKILRMDRDTTQKKEGHFEILNDFSEGNADILVGTQMVAKGHDFPNVTLVGILDADMSLYFSDYRSSERTFQLLTQVSGRSGRGSEPGKVVLQTYSPEHFVLKCATKYDYENFFNREVSIRSATGFPPFTVIIRLLVSGGNEESTLEVTKCIYDELNEKLQNKRDKIRFFGCMKAPIKKLQNKFRFQILLRIEVGNKDIVDSIFETMSKYRTSTVDVSMEINPNNLT